MEMEVSRENDGSAEKVKTIETKNNGNNARVVNVNTLIERLLNVGEKEKGLTKTISEDEIIGLCGTRSLVKAREILLSQPSLVRVSPPVNVCGDIHGQYADLLRLFHRVGFPPRKNYLFLGDYVDRGPQSLETILLLLCYKVKYRNNIVLLRGNHECPVINRFYGFMEECTYRYKSTRAYDALQSVFFCMPFTALIGHRILCMHGGISPKLHSLSQLQNISRPIEDVDPDSLELDLLWADPANVQGFQPSIRGASMSFGPDVILQCCRDLDIDLIARAHQVVQDGYELFANRRLVTIFSAPYYCSQYNNAAAIMSVDENLCCSFQILRPIYEAFDVDRKAQTPNGKSK